MAQSLPTSNYFTLVVYPDEMLPNTVNELYNLGAIFFSPIHNSQPIPNCFIGDFRPSDYKPPKKHQHVLIKCSNKITENAFIIRLCDVLHNNFTGVALHKGDSLVKSPDIMLRYFYHLDNPTKEHFNLETAFMDVYWSFTEEVIKAFNLEITMLVSYRINIGEIENIQQIQTYYPNSAVLTKWLFTGRNMYVVNSMFNEIRRNERLK